MEVAVRRQRWLPVGASALLGLLALLVCIRVWADVQYTYDPDGRLVQVVVADGSSAVYQYDAAGNITSIQRLAAGQLALVTSSSTAGSAGSSITLQGSGFSSTCSSDVVAFNGVAATVISCTPNQLVVQVPVGATAGPISVTVAGQTVNTGQTFNVTPAPAIATFSPAIVTVGSAVTVTGANLAPAGGTRVSLGGTDVSPTSISSSQLTLTAAGSGVITVTTQYGQASSATPLIAVPASIGSSNVLSSAALTMNGAAQSITVSQSGKYGAFTFNGTGQLVSIQIVGLTTVPSNASVSYQVFSPSGTQVASGSVSAASPTIQLSGLTTNGTYLVIFASGTLTSIGVTAAVEINPILDIGAAPLSVAASAPGQSKRFQFNAKAGQNIALVLSNMALAPSTPSTTIIPYVYQPDGTQLTYGYCYTTSPSGRCNVSLYNLAQTGTYTVLVNSPAQQAMSFNLSMVRAVTATLTLNTLSTINLTTAGQFAVVSFTIPVAQPIAFQFGPLTTTPANETVTATLYGPSGASISNLYVSSGSQTSNQTSLPAGTYTIVVIPPDAATGSIQLAIGSGVSGTVPADGTSINVSANVLGQSAYYTFSGTAGQSIALVLSNMVLTPSTPSSGISLYVYKPDGSSLVHLNCTTTSSTGLCSLPLYNLPQTGTYSLLVESPPQQKMSFSVSIVQAVTTTLTVNTPLNLNLTTPGQFAVVRFTLPTTQPIAFQLGSVTTTPTGQLVRATLYDPTGTSISNIALGSGSSQTSNLTSAPAGAYTIVAIPDNAAAASFQLAIGSGASGTVPADGTSTSVSTNVPGQSAYYTFSGTAGQSIALVLSNMVLTPSTPSSGISLYVYKPDGSSLVHLNCTTTSSTGLCSLPLYNLPQTGTYSLLVESPPQQKMSFSVSIVQAVTTTLTVNTPLNLNLTTPGQFAVVRFTLPTTQPIAFQLGSVTTTPTGQLVRATLYDPTGTSISNIALGSGSSQTSNQTSAPAGAYTIVAIPDNAAAASFQLAIGSGASGTVPADGTSISVSTNVPGQSAFYTFSGTAGQNIALVLSNMVLTPSTPSNTISPLVRKPDGSYLANPSCVTTSPSGGCNVTMYNLPQTGTYSVEVDSPPQQQISFGLSLVQALIATVTLNTPLSINLPTPGQFAVVSFTATAGQSSTLQLSSVTSTPTGQQIVTTVYDPSGTAVTHLNTSGSTVSSNLTNLSAGTYRIVIVPGNAATAGLQVSLQ